MWQTIAVAATALIGALTYLDATGDRRRAHASEVHLEERHYDYQTGEFDARIVNTGDRAVRYVSLTVFDYGVQSRWWRLTGDRRR